MEEAMRHIPAGPCKAPVTTVFVVPETIQVLERTAVVRILPSQDRVDLKGLSHAVLQSLMPATKPNCIRLDLVQSRRDWFYVLDSERMWLTEDLPSNIRKSALTLFNARRVVNAREVCTRSKRYIKNYRQAIIDEEARIADEKRKAIEAEKERARKEHQRILLEEAKRARQEERRKRKEARKQEKERKQKLREQSEKRRRDREAILNAARRDFRRHTKQQRLFEANDPHEIRREISNIDKFVKALPGVGRGKYAISDVSQYG